MIRYVNYIQGVAQRKLEVHQAAAGTGRSFSSRGAAKGDYSSSDLRPSARPQSQGPQDFASLDRQQPRPHTTGGLRQYSPSATGMLGLSPSSRRSSSSSSFNNGSASGPRSRWASSTLPADRARGVGTTLAAADPRRISASFLHVFPTLTHEDSSPWPQASTLQRSQSSPLGVHRMQQGPRVEPSSMLWAEASTGIIWVPGGERMRRQLPQGGDNSGDAGNAPPPCCRPRLVGARRTMLWSQGGTCCC